jgi:hypothetical protein
MIVVDDHERSDNENTSNAKQQQSNASLLHDGILAEDGFIMTVEEREYGISSFGTWLQFAHAGGWSFFISQLLFLILDRGFYMAGWWLARWADAAYTGMDMGSINFPPQTDGRKAQAQYVTVYVIIVSMSMIRSQWACTYNYRKLVTLYLTSLARHAHTFLLRSSLGFVILKSLVELDALEKCLMP